MLHVQKKLMRQSNFRNFAISCILSMIGNGLTYITMIWVLLQFHDSIASTAALMAAFWVPNVLLGPLAGVLVDRNDRRKALIVANLSRTIFLTVYAMVMLRGFSSISIYMLAALNGIGLALYAPAAISFVRELVLPKDLLPANAIVDIAYEFGSVLGMGCAGILIAWFGAPACFALNGLCYFIATMFLVRSKVQHPLTRKPNADGVWRQLFAGARYISKRRPLILMYCLQGLFFVCYMTAPVLLAPFAKAVLHVDVLQFGLLEAALSVGIVLGGLMIPAISKQFGMFPVLVALTVVGLVSFFGFSHSKQLLWAYFFHFLLGISFSLWALLTTLAQELTALSYQGRVQAFFNSVSGCVIIIFYYLLGHMERYRIEHLYTIEIVLYLCACGILFLYWYLYRNTKRMG